MGLCSSKVETDSQHGEGAGPGTQEGAPGSHRNSKGNDKHGNTSDALKHIGKVKSVKVEDIDGDGPLLIGNQA